MLALLESVNEEAPRALIIAGLSSCGIRFHCGPRSWKLIGRGVGSGREQLVSPPLISERSHSLGLALGGRLGSETHPSGRCRQRGRKGISNLCAVTWKRGELTFVASWPG